MLDKLRSIFIRSNNNEQDIKLTSDELVVPTELYIPEINQRLSLHEHVKLHLNYPMFDWDAIQTWVDSIDNEELQGKAWIMSEQAWLLHLQKALGNRYHIVQTDRAILLSSMVKNQATATLEYMTRTLKRVIKVLDGVAQVSPWGKDILIVFESEEEYYNYVSYYYNDDGEFAFSGGMFISSGCSHFVTVQSDLQTVEPIIAHEMTHACLSHLPLPLWLDEGLAVNTEQRLTSKPNGLYTPHEMHAKHLAFWGLTEVQEFWSGKSFSRSDDGNMLSYDLARILVETFAMDWASFKQFVLEARWEDAGAKAAHQHLGASLGQYISTLLDKEYSSEFEPTLNEIKMTSDSTQNADALIA